MQKKTSKATVVVATEKDNKTKLSTKTSEEVEVKEEKVEEKEEKKEESSLPKKEEKTVIKREKKIFEKDKIPFEKEKSEKVSSFNKDDFVPKQPKAVFNATTNVAYGTEAERVVGITFNKIANSVGSSLGPYGSYSIIESNDLNHQITKDGFTILSRIAFKESIPRIVINLIRKISENQVRKVGDGTTSAVIIANNLYHSLKAFKVKWNFPNSRLNKAIKEFEKLFEKGLQKYATKLEDLESKKDKETVILNIAKISSNQDEEIPDLILQAYKKFKDFNGIIVPERSQTEESELILKSGYEIPTTYIDRVFATEKDKKIAKYSNPKVLMVDGDISNEDIEAIGNLMTSLYSNTNGVKVTPLILIANKFSPVVRDQFLIENRKKNGLPIIAISASTATKQSKDRFYDLAIYLNAKPFVKADGDNLYEKNGNVNITNILNRCGTCKSFIGNERTSSFIDGFATKDQINTRIAEIKDEIKQIRTMEDEFDRTSETRVMEKRILLFQSGICVIKIGGNTEVEKDARFYQLEDAILAVKSMLENGFVTGGNLTIPFIISEQRKQLLEFYIRELKMTSDQANDFVNCFNTSFMKSFGKVLLNYFEKIDETDGKTSWKVLNFVRNMIQNKKMINMDNFEQLDYEFNPDNPGYEDFESSLVINPVNTEIEILKSSLSIVSYLVNSSQFVIMGFVE